MPKFFICVQSLFLSAIVSVYTCNSQADLLDLIDAFNNLESSAAISHQSTYTNLLLNGCNDFDQGPTTTCPDSTFSVFENIRELVHTANELTGDGPTQFSLGTDVESLGFALRWTSGEEFAAQGSLSGDFVNGQLASLASRITALRLGSRGFSVGSIGNFNPDRLYANANLLSGGGAAGEEYNPWGGFLNWSYGFGDKTATVLEDAFDFDGYQLNAGLDFRLNNNWAIGSLFAYTQQEIDFDSTQSIVEGGVESDGFSLMPFVLYQSDSWFGNVSLGYQTLAIDTDRAIRYASLNPNVGNTNTRSVSSTDATTLSISMNVGYTFRHEFFSIEPYFELENSSTKIDGFTERDINNTGFDLRVGDQKIDSTETVFGVNLNFSLTPSFGVFLPYIDFQKRSQLDDDSRVIASGFSGSSNSAAFNLTTDKVDSDYFVTTLGVSTVLRGGRQSSADSGIGGGIQAFVNYKIIGSLENYSQNIITAGLRYEF